MSAPAARPRKPASRKVPAVQYAALPYRLAGDRLEVLLITSRRTHRWIIPKGWPMEGCGPTVCAAREALEEAGVRGVMRKTSIGHFRYLKHLRNGADYPCRVEVFPLKVTRERDDWAEKKARERRWLPAAEAAAQVGDPQLRLVILRFRARVAARSRARNGAGGT